MLFLNVRKRSSGPSDAVCGLVEPPEGATGRLSAFPPCERERCERGSRPGRRLRTRRVMYTGSEPVGGGKHHGKAPSQKRRPSPSFGTAEGAATPFLEISRPELALDFG